MGWWSRDCAEGLWSCERVCERNDGSHTQQQATARSQRQPALGSPMHTKVAPVKVRTVPDWPGAASETARHTPSTSRVLQAQAGRHRAAQLWEHRAGSGRVRRSTGGVGSS